MADFPLVLIVVAWLIALAVVLIVVGVRKLTRRGVRPFAPTRAPRAEAATMTAHPRAA